MSGGADGVVSLYSSKRWPSSEPLWARQCHDAGVTCVILHSGLQLAMSCGRDGKLILHENALDATALVSRVICRVSGEVRSMEFDTARRRVFIAGDSLRCLDMSQGKFNIYAIPFHIPHPIVALAVSPCGRLAAIASASGAAGIVSTTVAASSSTEKTEQQPPRQPFLNIQLSLPRIFAPSAKQDDAVAYRMSWCCSEDGAALLLMVPAASEVRVFRVDGWTPPRGDDASTRDAIRSPALTSGAAAAPLRLREVGGLRSGDLTDFHTSISYPVSKSRIGCLIATRSGIAAVKVNTKTFLLHLHALQRYTTTITDLQLNAANGDLVVGLSDGTLSLLPRVALKEWRGATAACPASTGTEESPEPQSHSSDVHLLSRPTKTAAVEDEERHGGDDVDDTASESSASSSPSSSSAATEDSGLESEAFEEVVEDLQRDGASLRGNDTDRPSRWRNGDPSAAPRDAQQEQRRSRFLDDEAEEASDGDAASEDEAADADDGYGNRRPHRSRTGDRFSTASSSRRDNMDQLDEEEEEEAEHFDADDTELSGYRDSAAVGGSIPTDTAAVEDYSFQVGATPTGEEGSCYLAYNSVGYIHSTREHTTIHFHDISLSAVRLHEKGQLLMGALSPVGAGFVVAPTESSEMMDSVDEVPRLTIFYHAFTALGAQSEWRVRLRAGETVRCMTAGIRFLAVATSHYLRIYSLSGLELAVLSKLSRIVAMAGTSSRKLMKSFKADFDPLAIVALDYTGVLTMEVLDVGSRSSILPTRPVPLTELPNGSVHQLQWLGWSEDGPLHVVDTAGVVRMFTGDWGGSWVPVYDPRSSVDQSFALWIWGVSDDYLFAYRSSRDDSPHPAAVASGLPTERVSVFLPLTRTGAESEMVSWDQLLRRQIRADELKRHSSFYTAAIAQHDAAFDKRVLQLFEAALKAQQTTRAMDLAMMLELRDNVEQCAKTANAQGHVQLVHRLASLYGMRVKAKSKRRCTLPLEGSAVSERERDLLLRRLLLQEKQASAKAGDTASSASPAAVSAAVSMPSGDVTPPRALSTASSMEAPQLSPAQSSATTATTLATGASPASKADARTQRFLVDNEKPSEDRAEQPARRRITFATDATQGSATNSTSSSTTCSSDQVIPRRAVNPFMKASPSSTTASSSMRPPIAAEPPIAPSASTPSAAANFRQSVLPVAAGQHHRISGMAASASSGSTTPSLLGAPSTPAVEDGAAAKLTAGSSAPRLSAGHTSPDIPVNHSATKVSTFTPVALPNYRPTDPFLADSSAAPPDGQRSTHEESAEEPVVSLETLLDAGHSDRMPVVRSNSFGEALRKRYRDEDDEDDAEESVEGHVLSSALQLPKISSL